MFFAATAAWLTVTVGSLWLARGILAGPHSETWGYLFCLVVVAYLAALPCLYYLLDRRR